MIFLLCICGSEHIFIPGVQKGVTIGGEQVEADFAAILHRARDTISCTVDRPQRTNQKIFESNRNDNYHLSRGIIAHKSHSLAIDVAFGH